MAKKLKFPSMYRTTWSSVKRQCDPGALKKCDFSKGLGPALDKLSTKCDQAWEIEPVEDKALQDLKKSVDSIQKIIAKYRAQVLKCNQKYPEHGETWLNLHNALKRVDEMLIDELKDLGVPGCTKLSGWASKSDFAKRPVEGTIKDDVDLSAQVERLVKNLQTKQNDIKKIAKTVGTKALGAFFPYSPRIAESIIREGSSLDAMIKFIDQKLKCNPPEIDMAQDCLRQVQAALNKMYAVLGKDKGKFKDFMELKFYSVLEMQILAIETRN